MKLDWPPTLETFFYQGIILYRPIGIHKHIRHILIQRFILNNSGIHVPIDHIKAALDDLYDIEYMETLTKQEFELPFEEYDDIMELHRRAEEESQSEEEKVKKPVKKASRVLRKKKK
jgi:hypothetical protein